MKKILYSILAAAAVTAACTQFEMDTVPAYDKVSDPTVTAEVVSDSVITVTITAGENTHYYGYAVVEGRMNATAANLVANKYAGNSAVVIQNNAPQAAQVKYSAETKTVSLELKNLKPFTEYSVYAAAVNTMGVESAVVAKYVRTTDGTQPTMVGNLSSYANFQEEDGVLTVAIPFNDKVLLTGNGTAQAHFYAENYTDERGYLVIYKTVEIPAANMAVSGNNLILSVPKAEYIPGALVSFTYSDDIVRNGAGRINDAFNKNLMAYIEGQLAWNGIVAYYDYQNWDFSIVDPATLPDEEEGGMEGEDDEEEEEEKVPVYFSAWDELAMVNYTTSKYPLAGKNKNASVVIYTCSSSGREVKYNATTWGVLQSRDKVAIYLDEAPEYGSTVSYTIAEGSVYDIFGNENNEFTAEEEYYFSYGYTLDDIVGDYAYIGISALGSSAGQQVPGTMKIEVSDNKEEGNVMITSFAGLKCKTPIYVTFNPDSGSIDIFGEQPFCDVTLTDGTAATAMFYTYQYYWLNMKMTEPGYISQPNDIFGVYLVAGEQPLGWSMAFNNFVAMRLDGEAPAKAERASLMPTVGSVEQLPLVEKK